MGQLCTSTEVFGGKAAQNVFDVLLANRSGTESGEASLHEEDHRASPQEEEGVVLLRLRCDVLRCIGSTRVEPTRALVVASQWESSKASLTASSAATRAVRTASVVGEEALIVWTLDCR